MNVLSVEQKQMNPKDKHIDFRVNYIEGAGQLCDKCIEKYEE